MGCGYQFGAKSLVTNIDASGGHPNGSRFGCNPTKRVGVSVFYTTRRPACQSSFAESEFDIREDLSLIIARSELSTPGEWRWDGLPCGSSLTHGLFR